MRIIIKSYYYVYLGPKVDGLVLTKFEIFKIFKDEL